MNPSKILAALLMAMSAITPLVNGAVSSSVTKASPPIAANARIFITDMRTEGVMDPLGIEEVAPRFSWRYEASAQAPRGFIQSAARIQVASSAEKLAKGEADMWDSGKTPGSDTLSAIYAGKPLQSTTRYYWQVTGFDAAGQAYASKPHFFETGLSKAEDWCGAQWIGANTERPRTLPANLHQLTDYIIETRFRILEGSATVLFRAYFMGRNEYTLEIKPGIPGSLAVKVANRDTKGKTELLKEYPLPSLSKDEWHSLQVSVKGGDFTFLIDNKPVGTEPLHNDTIKAGTVALGTLPEGEIKGLVQYDDFRLITDGKPLVEESFDNPALFAFQDFFFSNNAYVRVKDGILETRGVITYLEPKTDLEAPRFRKDFQIKSGKITHARAYVSGLGYYKFWLNRERMDDYYMNPGFARYNKTAYYCVYDITEQIKANNLLGFELGRGWYGMTTPTLWGETFLKDWMAEPALRVLVTIDYADGTRQTIASDPSFKTAPGPILFDSVKAGEVYDARKEQPGWNTVAYDDKGWGPAVLAKGNMPSAAPGLTAQLFEPIRTVESYSPVDIQKVEDEKDTWKLDFGKILAGTVQMKIKAKAGQKIRLTYVEVLDHNNQERWNNFGSQHTGNFQQDIYVAKGDGEEVYESSYCYKGFQFVRVEGLTEKPTPDQFIAKEINSDMVKVGAFKSSSELWNKIWEASRRSIQGNMHSIPTDCPTYEKLGWTCDDSGSYYAMAYNYDLRKLYDKRLQDYADDIWPDGRIRNTLPSAWGKGEDPAWVGSYVNLVWKQYQIYGDRRVVERHYDNLKLYMTTLIKEGMASEKPPLLTKPRGALGDCSSPDGMSPEGALIYFDAYFYRYVRMMHDMATLLGRTEDIAYYGKMAADLKEQYNAFFFDPKEGCYFSSNRSVGFRQSPQAVSLAFGLVPEEQAARVTERLVQDIQKRQGHIWVGILGMEAIADALSENGRDDIAYSGHLQDTGPSLGNMIREGATTLWEGFSTKARRSLNHRFFSSPLGWMARYVAGLRVEGILDGGAGFRKAVIEPHPVPSLVTFAQLDYDSPVGRYHSGWKVTDNGMAYEITIPPNATAVFRLPLLGKNNATVIESGKILWLDGKPTGSVAGVSAPKQENDQLVFTLGSGSYAFKVIP